MKRSLAWSSYVTLLGILSRGSCLHIVTRRDVLRGSAGVATAAVFKSAGVRSSSAAALDGATTLNRRAYDQRFPTLFDPLWGSSSRETVKRQIDSNVWTFEQSLVLGPLETPLRSVVVKLADGKLWVHAPLAPTEEYFELVESCGPVGHVVVPTYALEHKVGCGCCLCSIPIAPCHHGSYFYFDTSLDFALGFCQRCFEALARGSAMDVARAVQLPCSFYPRCLDMGQGR